MFGGGLHKNAPAGDTFNQSRGEVSFRTAFGGAVTRETGVVNNLSLDFHAKSHSMRLPQGILRRLMTIIEGKMVVQTTHHGAPSCIPEVDGLMAQNVLHYCLLGCP